mmetsp:Transcript_45119/g.118344  ORF Transcript_45119/g.118344 Transcript_45119/m.118344 type:complete len:441 (-) Transcript_45119:305-1627(-)
MPGSGVQRNYRSASLLVTGVIVLWASEINLMKSVATWDECLNSAQTAAVAPPAPPTSPQAGSCPWKNPVFVGIALKMIFVLVLPPALCVRSRQLLGERQKRPLVDRRFFLLSGVLSLFLLGASVTWVASIPLTLATINTALYQLYTPLTYVFSIPILREGLSASKALGVLVALASVLMIIMSNGDADDSDGDGQLLGDLLVLASAALYALKGVVYKKWFGNEVSGGGTGSSSSGADGIASAPRQDLAQQTECSELPQAVEVAASPSSPIPTPLTDAAIAVGLMGLWSCMLGPIILATAHATGLEEFSWPPVAMAGGYVLVATMMALYMCCLYSALAFSSPTFVSVSSLFVAPVTLIWDVAAGRAGSVSYVAFLGVAFLIGSLLLIIFAEEIDANLRVYARRCWHASVGCNCTSMQQPLLHVASTRRSSDPSPPAAPLEEE